MKPKKHTLADAHEAALRLVLLPDEDALTESDLDFLRSDLVGELLEGKWPEAFRWTSYGKQN
jgi:hypothetical protein